MKDHMIKTTERITVLLAVLLLLTFCNPAGVIAGSNIPVTADIAVTYIVKGNEKTAGGDTVTLTADDPASPMPGGTEAGKKEITIRKEGTYSFGEMHYDKPGVHWYTITRNVTKKKGVTKDGTTYKAKVIALNDGHGYVLVYKQGSDEKSELVYIDKVAPDTGDTGRILIDAGITLAAAVSLAAFAVFRTGKRKNGGTE